MCPLCGRRKSAVEEVHFECAIKEQYLADQVPSKSLDKDESDDA